MFFNNKKISQNNLIVAFDILDYYSFSQIDFKNIIDSSLPSKRSLPYWFTSLFPDKVLFEIYRLLSLFNINGFVYNLYLLDEKGNLVKKIIVSNVNITNHPNKDNDTNNEEDLIEDMKPLNFIFFHVCSEYYDEHNLSKFGLYFDNLS